MHIVTLYAKLLVLMVIATIFVPDSPVYLMQKGKESDARKSMELLRGKEFVGIDDEINAIKISVTERNDPKYRISLRQIFSSSVYLKPFCMSLVLMFLMQFSGINQVVMYMQLIFEKAESTLDQGLSTFIVSIMQVRLTFIRM